MDGDKSVGDVVSQAVAVGQDGIFDGRIAVEKDRRDRIFKHHVLTTKFLQAIQDVKADLACGRDVGVGGQHFIKAVLIVVGTMNQGLGAGLLGNLNQGYRGAVDKVVQSRKLVLRGDDFRVVALEVHWLVQDDLGNPLVLHLANHLLEVGQSTGGKVRLVSEKFKDGWLVLEPVHDLPGVRTGL